MGFHIKSLTPKLHTPIVKDALLKLWQEEQPRLFYWSPVALGLGIGAYFMAPKEPDLAEALTVLALAAIALIVSRGALAPRAVFLMALGFATASLSSHMYSTNMLDWPTRATLIEARIIDVEQHKSGRRLLLENVHIEKLPPRRAPERIRLVMPRRLDKQAPDIKPGQHIQAIAKVMPLSEPMTPNGFDFRRNAFFRGIGATGYLMGKIKISEANEQTDTGIQLWFAQLRQKIQAMIKNHLDGDRAGLAIILMTGDQTSLSEDTADAMRSVGLAHLLAIAGLHVGLVAGIVFFLARALLALFPYVALRFPIKKWAALLALLAIIFFTLQVGAPVPTRRAVIMTGVVLLAIMLDRMSLSLRSVTLAAFIILLIWPQMLLHPAFQLSFAAVLGLIAMGEHFRTSKWTVPHKPGVVNVVTRHIWELAAMSVVATVGTLPFCLYHFQEAETYSVLANTLAIPLTSFWLMPLCVITELSMLIGLEAWPLKILNPGLDLLINLSHGIAGLPGAHVNPPPMPMSLLLFATFGGLFCCLTTGRKRWAGLAVLLLAVGLSFAQPRPFLYLSPDGKQAGWWNKETKEIVVASTLDKPDKYLANYWAERFGYKEENIRYVGKDETDVPPLLCDENKCVGKNITWLKSAAALPQVCEEEKGLIVNGLDRNGCADSMKQILTRESFRRHGAHAAYETPEGLLIQTSRQDRALRPWSVGWRYKEGWLRL